MSSGFKQVNGPDGTPVGGTDADVTQSDLLKEASIRILTRLFFSVLATIETYTFLLIVEVLVLSSFLRAAKMYCSTN